MISRDASRKAVSLDVRRSRGAMPALKFILSWMMIGLSSFLLGRTEAQVVGVDICACSPSVYEFTLDFFLTCLDTNIEGQGIVEFDCSVSATEGGTATDLTPVAVSSIDILELDQDLAPLASTTRFVNFRNGDRFNYTSIIANPSNINASSVPKGFQLSVVGQNVVDESLLMIWIITFTNDCDSFPILFEGERIGWTIFSDLFPPDPSLCPKAAVPVVPTIAPTPGVSAPPTRSPSTSTVEPQPPTRVPAQTPVPARPTVRPGTSTDMPTATPDGPTVAPSESPAPTSCDTGKGKGKGKGKGESGKGKGKGESGKGKGKGESGKGNGKGESGKGKGESSTTKSGGKGKGADSPDDTYYGKGKGKGSNIFGRGSPKSSSNSTLGDECEEKKSKKQMSSKSQMKGKGMDKDTSMTKSTKGSTKSGKGKGKGDSLTKTTKSEKKSDKDSYKMNMSDKLSRKSKSGKGKVKGSMSDKLYSKSESGKGKVKGSMSDKQYSKSTSGKGKGSMSEKLPTMDASGKGSGKGNGKGNGKGSNSTYVNATARSIPNGGDKSNSDTITESNADVLSKTKSSSSSSGGSSGLGGGGIAGLLVAACVVAIGTVAVVYRQWKSRRAARTVEEAMLLGGRSDRASTNLHVNKI